jgi:hypothetical protein
MKGKKPPSKNCARAGGANPIDRASKTAASAAISAARTGNRKKNTRLVI